MAVESRIIRRPAVLHKTGISKSTLANKLSPKSPWYDPSFPKSIKIGHRSVGWIEAEVDRWILDRAMVRSRQEELQ